MNLELGSGLKPTKNALHTDIIRLPHIEVLCSADNLPFKNNVFEQVYAFDVVEHIENTIKLFEEIWRVLKTNGKFTFTTCWYLSPVAWRDITHKHHFALGSFNVFDKTTYDGKHYGYYTKASFRIIKKSLSSLALNIYIEMLKI